MQEVGWAALAAFLLSYCVTWGIGIGAAGAGRGQAIKRGLRSVVRLEARSIKCIAEYSSIG